MKRYRVVDLDEAEEGMQLYQDVHDHQGNLLLPRLARLEEGQLRSLRRRNIEVLRIVDETATSEQLAAERDRVAERLAHLFRRAGPGPAAAMLRAAVEGYRLEDLK